MANSSEENFVADIIEDYETHCWGCGLSLVLPSYAPVFKCGWGGAITNKNLSKLENEGIRWRRIRDRCFVCILSIFILFVICGGVWSVYPVVFSVSCTWGIFHAIITSILSISTLSTFTLSSFKSAGRPPSILWGSYPAVGKGDLENYTFCYQCSNPKSPRTHHCRTCGMCVLDMDHHCPFIGNCVGAANHRHFIGFLISAVISTIYASIMFAYTSVQILPSVTHGSVHADTYSTSGASALRAVKKLMFAFLSNAIFMSARGLILIYLFVACVSVGIGLSVLLWQQLCYIYEGKTYLIHLSSRGIGENDEKSCQNIIKFFGCPYSISRYLPTVPDSRKRHKK